MTRSVEIPEAAREKAAAELYGAIGGAVSRFPDVDPDIQDHYRDLADLAITTALPYLAPAGDGGLREALEKALESPTELWHGNSFRVKALPETTLRELLAEHPAAPAVPQPVDREAMRGRIAKTLHDMDHMHTWERCDDACGIAAYQRADGVLALLGGSVLAGEQEQVAPE